MTDKNAFNVETPNHEHARAMYAQKPVISKKLKELQLRFSGVLREGDGHLGDFDEMHSRECAMTEKNAFDVDKPNHEEDSTMITTAFELLDASIQRGSHNMKAMDSSLNLVLSLMEEVRLKEKSAEESKEEAAKSGLDILAKAEALKREQQHLKETNDMHAREVCAQKAVLAKELKELQLRLSGVLHEGDGYLGDFDEMSKLLKMRLAKAVNAKELADKEKLEKEALALEALAFEESQMLKLEEESERLKTEEVKNSKLQDLLKEREFVTNILHGDILDKYPDISLLRERIDQPVLQPGGFKSFSQTPSCFSSLSSSLTGLLNPFQEQQLKTVESVVTPKETTDEHAKIAPPQNEQLSKIPARLAASLTKKHDVTKRNQRKIIEEKKTHYRRRG